MKRFGMRMYAALLTAALAAVPMTGCSTQKETGSSLEISMDNSYRTERMEISLYYDPRMTWGNLVLATRSNGGNGPAYESLLCYNTETQEKIDFELASLTDKAPANNLNVGTLLELPDDRLGIVCCEYKLNFTTQEEEITRQCMEIYDADMNYIETQEIPDTFVEGARLTSGNTWMDENGNWYYDHYNSETDTSTLEIYNSDFELICNVAVPAGNNIVELVPDGNGGMYACMVRFSEKTYHEMYRISPEDGTCLSTDVKLNPRGFDDFMKGSNGYDYYYLDDYGMYGIKDKEIVQVVSCINSDLPLGEIWNCYVLENGCYAFNGIDGMRLASPRTQEEIDSTELISLSTVGMFQELEEAVIDYNRAETGYRIIVVDYGIHNTTDDETLGYAKLKEDMLNGIVADIICTDGMNFESLASKGLFEDWYELMDADETFNREEYLTNFFEAYEYNGELQRLGVSYSVHTTAAKSEFAGSEEGVSPEAYWGMRDTIPEDMDFFLFSTREWMMREWFLNKQHCFINRENTECHFDTPEFAALLEMLKAMPGDYNWSEEEMAAQFDSYDDGEFAFQRNTALVEPYTISQPIHYRALRRAVFRDAEITLLGYPMYDDAGNGGVFDTLFTISINKQSQQKDAIWSFMKHLLSEEYQLKLTDSMPIHKGALEAKLDEATQMITAKSNIAGIDSFIGASTEEEMAELRTYIEGIRTCKYLDETVYSILLEETEMYFAGERSAEETADIVQSRVSLYLSEQS